nr:probable pre-mRNA-splicing factor ATP-dependent RNA helicase DEAH4 [Tanacetum cinerariifolium]
MIDNDSEISIFSCKGRPLGSPQLHDISEAELKKIHTYILNNCDELEELIKYVIDSGHLKQRQYNPSTGIEQCRMSVYIYVATVPEIQRSSLAGSVLYVKSLDLLDIDILKFDFLDAPSPESLQDALKQLFLIDAIDANGTITSIWKTMADLPLEPLLARTLIEANKNDYLPQALTVAAMLSVEGTLLHGRSKHTNKKRKQTPSELPDGSGWSDHIQLLQIYELWDLQVIFFIKFYANGTITSIGKTMAELPLEPLLARTLIEANKNDCLPQALTVAAMLSVEGTLLPGRSKHTDKKRKQTPLELPDGSGWSDHIQLLQIYELWGLQVRGMLFVKNVRKQLCQIMQKFEKGA